MAPRGYIVPLLLHKVNVKFDAVPSATILCAVEGQPNHDAIRHLLSRPSTR